MDDDLPADGPARFVEYRIGPVTAQRRLLSTDPWSPLHAVCGSGAGAGAEDPRSGRPARPFPDPPVTVPVPKTAKKQTGRASVASTS